MSNVAKLKTSEPPPEAPADPLAKLREPFPAHQISKLPKPTKAQTDAVKADFKKGVRCGICGSWHHPDVIHLDYVGHAALTDRLLDTDPQWSWEPAAFRDGLPAFDQTGGLWIKLTVCGVTRLGYGHAAAKPGADPGSREKEVIGDALRNAAMRFGAALDLWHKGDLHGPADQSEDQSEEPAPQDDRRPAALVAAEAAILMLDSVEACDKWKRDNAKALEAIEDNDVFNAIVRAFKQHRTSLLPLHPKANPPKQVQARQDFDADQLEGAFND